MMNRFDKKKMSLWPAVLISAAVGLGIQLVGSAVAAYMVGEGILAESLTDVAAYVVRGIGMVAAILTAWKTSDANKMAVAVITAGILYVLPMLCSMLFWDFDWTKSVPNLLYCAAVFAITLWLANGTKKGSGLRKIKRRYC